MMKTIGRPTWMIVALNMKNFPKRGSVSSF